MTEQPSKKTGRPRKAADERRDAVLPPVRVTFAERQHIEAQAARAGLPLVEYCRRVLLRRTVKARMSEADEAAILALNRAGVNLNQIAARVNMTGDLADDFGAVLVELRAAIQGIVADGS